MHKAFSRIYIIVILVVLIAGGFLFYQWLAPQEEVEPSKEKVIEKVEKEGVLFFNPTMNSGWFYLAHSVLEKGLTFWVAIERSFSTQIVDDSARLMYGIVEPERNYSYSDTLEGTFSEVPNKVDLIFKFAGIKIVEFLQTKEDLSEFKLKLNLPWAGPLGEDRFLYERTLILESPAIWGGKTGIIQLEEVGSCLYLSLLFQEGFLVEFQKFNLSSPTQAPIFRFGNLNSNHRWGYFKLNEDVGSLPQGTVGIYWEIFDKNEKLQQANLDLLIPGETQKTRESFQIKEMDYWNSGHKIYLKKWRLIQKDLGIDLIFETLIPNQEQIVRVITPEFPNWFYFYEGAVKVIEGNSGKEVGTGMLEETHDESKNMLKEGTSKWIDYFNQKWGYLVKYSPSGQVRKELREQSQVYFLINNLGVWIEAYPNEEGIQNLEELAEMMNYFPPDTNVSYKYIRKYVEKHLEIDQETTQIDSIPAIRLTLKTKPAYGGKRIGEVVLFFGENKKSYYFIKSSLAFDPINSPEFTKDKKELFDIFVFNFKFVEKEVTAWKAYRNEEYGYELEYPQDWEVISRKPSGIYLSDIYFKSQFGQGLNILVADDYGLSPKEWIAEASGLTPAQVISEEEIKIGKITGLGVKTKEDGILMNRIILPRDQFFYQHYMIEIKVQEKSVGAIYLDQILPTFKFLD